MTKSTRRASKRAAAGDRQKTVRNRTSLKAGALYQELFASSPDGILVIDAETQRVLEFNDAACRQLGYTREEFAGLSISDYEASETPEKIGAHVQALLREGTAEFDTLHRTKTSEIRHMHVWAKTFDLDGRVVVHAIFRDITAWKSTAELEQANLVARETDERLRGVFENAVVGIYRTTVDGGILMANQALVDMLGYSSVEELTQRNLEQSGFEPDYPRLQFKELMERKGHVKGLESIWKRRDGTIILVRESARNIRDTQGKSIYFEGTVEDITERKRAEDALRQRQQQLEEAQRVAHVGSWDRVLATGTIAWSEELCRIYGVDPKLPIPDFKDLAQFYTTESWARLRAAVEKALQTGAPFELDVQIVRTDGKVIWATTRCEVLRDATGQIIGTRGTILDITDRKQAESELHLQSAALNAAADAIVITDRTGGVEWVNPAFTQLTGYPAEEALGKNPRDLIKSGKHAPAFYRDLWETILAGRTWHGEMINRRKDGSLYTEDQAITPILDGSGAITHFVAIKTDITERLQLEAQFRQAQKMDSVGQLASGIAHDFNNLLTVINGTSELLLAQVRPDDPVHADVQEIHRAGERASTLTRQLLAFSRQQILEPRVMNFNEAVAGMESLLRRLLGEDIDLVVVPTPGVGNVKADPGQIEQVMTNLAVNARDAMPQGGQLTIETQNVTITEADARRHGVAMAPGPYVRLAVRDSGVGMDEATRAHIFEPFFTTKGPGKGTGLGLSTVYGIVKQSHGFIWVESEVGQGTSFKIYLPRVTEAAGTDRPAKTAVSSSGTETILLVEDNAGLRKLVTRFLAPAGYTVLGAANGEDALRLLERHDAPVHLLLSDVVMPGMSGRQLAERLAPIRPGMKVLYMSGYTSDTIVRHGVLDAQVPFLNKPFTAAALLRKVREVLDSQA
jgi:two-component system cell cycle sensor histidine kinase/response regulator CckA